MDIKDQNWRKWLKRYSEFTYKNIDNIIPTIHKISVNFCYRLIARWNGVLFNK